ncbi:hypothetical protein ONR57_17880 [Hoyosella sp. YIM 151337]|uniref:hypothetical protein n=1 Tax=Hoyosella sp. YIM 151337 TaxID=2992742 RepID=UPI002235FBC6|nr:hypothetical protein [Hoyosella sp. YIM 151337]MCW4355179.1 hypothetical protein [Hoyosella sp. YIM 151337]
MRFAPPDDPAAPLRAAVRYGVIGLIVLAVAGSIIAYLAAGLSGLWGALIGAAVGGGFILFTALSVLFSARYNALTAGALILGGWALKMLLALVVFAVLSNMTFYSQPALAIVVIAALILVLGAETYGVLKQRTPYVTPTREKVISDTNDDEK